MTLKIEIDNLLERMSLNLEALTMYMSHYRFHRDVDDGVHIKTVEFFELRKFNIAASLILPGDNKKLLECYFRFINPNDSLLKIYKVLTFIWPIVIIVFLAPLYLVFKLFLVSNEYFSFRYFDLLILLTWTGYTFTSLYFNSIQIKINNRILVTKQHVDKICADWVIALRLLEENKAYDTIRIMIERDLTEFLKVFILGFEPSPFLINFELQRICTKAEIYYLRSVYFTAQNIWDGMKK